MINALAPSAGTAYFGLGLLQFVAMFAGLTDWIGLHWIIAGPISLLVAGIPLVGTALGVMGAMTAWGWPLMHALALFFGPLIVIAVIVLGAGALESTQGRIRG